MKSIIFCLLMFFTFQVNAQLSISTNFRQDAIWDAKLEKWDVLSTDEGKTLFEFDRELSQFKHTTPTISSVYTIDEWEYDEDEVKYDMTVTSDAGNTYEMIVDGINNCVAFFYWRGDQYYLVRHTIEETKFNE